MGMTMANDRAEIRNLLRRMGPMCPSQIAATLFKRVSLVEDEAAALAQDGLIKVVGSREVRGQTLKVYAFK